MNSLSLPREARLRARASAPSIVLFVTAILLALGERVPQPAAFPNAELVLFAALALMLIGIGLALYSVPLGVALAAVGFAGFWALTFSATGSLRLAPAYLLFPIVSAVQLGSWWSARRARGSRRRQA